MWNEGVIYFLIYSDGIQEIKIIFLLMILKRYYALNSMTLECYISLPFNKNDTLLIIMALSKYMPRNRVF